MQQVGGLALGLALDADAVVVAIGGIGEGVLTDLLMLQRRVIEPDADILPRLEAQHGLAVDGRQHEGGDKLALLALLLDEEGAGPLPTTELARLFPVELPLPTYEDVCQHAIGLAPGLQYLVRHRTATHFFERGQEMTTHNVILFRLDQETRVLVGDAFHGSGQGPQVVDIPGVGRHGTEQSQGLTATALMGQVEHILQLGVVVEHALVEVLGEGRPRRFEQRNGALDDGDGGLV